MRTAAAPASTSITDLSVEEAARDLLTEAQLARLRRLLQEMRVQAPGSRIVERDELQLQLYRDAPDIAAKLLRQGELVSALSALGLCEAHSDCERLALTA